MRYEHVNGDEYLNYKNNIFLAASRSPHNFESYDFVCKIVNDLKIKHFNNIDVILTINTENNFVNLFDTSYKNRLYAIERNKFVSTAAKLNFQLNGFNVTSKLIIQVFHLIFSSNFIL